jgi:beta-lactam-binding protein with PASTA domain
MTRRNFFRLGLYLLLMVMVALASTAVTMRLAIHGAEVSVPDLSNLTLADARQRAQSAHLSIDLSGQYYSNEIPAGHVLTQRPAPGTVVRHGWRIRVSESLGPRQVPIPDVVGQPERISSIRIRRLGLELGSVAHLPFPSEPDVVMAQNPPANSSDIARPRISILIADEPAATAASYVMPDFVGRPREAARDAIQRAGLRLAPQAPISPPAPSAPAPLAPAPVSEQAVAPATSAAAGAPSSAPTPAPGAPAENVAQPQPSPSIPGMVTGQFPPAGSRVDAQTLIRLVISQ